MDHDDFIQMGYDNPGYDRQDDEWFDNFLDLMEEGWEYLIDKYGEDFLDDLDLNEDLFWEIFGEFYDAVYG